MEFQSIVNALVCVVFVFATSGIPTAFGHVAGSRGDEWRCNHDQLYAAGGKMFECQNFFIQQYLGVMYENYKNGSFDLQEACKIHNVIAFEQSRYCPLKFADACLPDYFSNFINNLYDALTLDCNHPTPYYLQNKFETAMKELKENCKNYPLCPFGFFNFDKQCSDAERLEAFYKVTDCSFWTFVFGLPSDAIMDFKKGDDEICKTLTYMLDVCFNENECFSQRELGMGRDLVATSYKTIMEPLSMIANEFGSLTEFVEFVNNDVALKWNDHTITLPISFVREVLRFLMISRLDDAVVDYNTYGCELNPFNDLI